VTEPSPTSESLESPVPPAETRLPLDGRTRPRNPADLLATDFGKPAELFEKFPRRDVFTAPKGI
jgi:hypothetical protein